MAAILMVNVPYAGHTNPTLPLAAALVRQGHEVTYVNAEEFRGRIQATGAEFIPYADYPAAPTGQQRKARCFRAAFDTAVRLRRRFDVLLYEMFFYPGMRVAEILGIPCVRQFSQPAWNESTVANATRLFRLSLALIDAQVMGKGNARHMGQSRTMGEAVIYDRPQLNVVYVPRIFQPGAETFGGDYLFTVPEATNTVAAAREIPYGAMRPPIVYISLGSIISSRGFCRACIRAFGGKDVSVILNTGKIRPESLGAIPANIHAYSFVPQIEVLRHTDVFVTHGGMNSVNEAMRYGVPMVALPFINDQIANAKRIVELGIGRRERALPVDAKRLYEAVMGVCGDEAMRGRSREIMQMLERETALDEVVARIEALMDVKP